MESTSSFGLASGRMESEGAKEDLMEISKSGRANSSRGRSAKNDDRMMWSCLGVRDWS